MIKIILTIIIAKKANIYLIIVANDKEEVMGLNLL